MQHESHPLHGEFGVVIEDVSPADLRDPDFRDQARELWLRHRGLLALRGDALCALAPRELLDWAEVFGAVERVPMAGREASMVEDTPILRIGNVRDEAGALRAQFAKVPPLANAADIRYDPATRRPVWHTDSTFREHPPIGSVFHCKQAPPRGGETLFADMRGAFAALDAATRERLSSLEAVCSLAHHDKKISLYSSGYPTLTPQQRAANPPRRVPLVLTHPVTGEPALYGMNSSTCAVVPAGAPVPAGRMDLFDLEGIEDESVAILRDLLPHATGPDFALAWRWQAGDVVVWDNRCTLHAATGYEHERFQREMWRLTLVEEVRAREQSVAEMHRPATST